MKGARKAEEVNLFSQSIALPQVHSLFICNAFSLFLACRDYTAVGTNLTVFLSPKLLSLGTRSLNLSGLV